MEENKKELNFFSEGDFYIFGNFEDDLLKNLIPHFIKEIEKKKKEKNPKINFYINSFGGYVYILKELLSLFDLAKKEGIIVSTHVSGYAYSCGSALAVSGTKGHRYVSKYAEHLCHLGRTGFYAKNDIELEREGLRAKAHFDFVRKVYSENCSIKNLDEVIKDDSLFIMGQDLIDMGLADKIIGVDD